MYIIHAVGPDCRQIMDCDAYLKRVLSATYQNSLKLAVENGIKSIAFPFISAGIYAFPKELASKIAVESVRDFVTSHTNSLEEIMFVLFSDEDFGYFEKYF